MVMWGRSVHLTTLLHRIMTMNLNNIEASRTHDAPPYKKLIKNKIAESEPDQSIFLSIEMGGNIK